MNNICLSKVKRFTLSFKFVLFACFLVFQIPVFAQGDLLITPRRIVFEGNKQREDITLVNTGKEPATYTVSFVQYHMTEDGSFEVITEPREGQMFADSYLRFFPRQVTLGPGESQVVRMQLRILPNMVEGEYRSHLYFRAVPEERPLGEEALELDSTSIGIQLTPIFGITIPVLIRIGNLNASVSLSDLNLERKVNGPPVIHVTFKRTGNQSVFGDLKIDFVPEGGSPISVGMVRGIAIYTPNTMRRFSIQLNENGRVVPDRGKYIVRYTSSSDINPEVLAEAEYIFN